MHHGQEAMNPRRNPRNPTSPAPVTCTIEKGIPIGMPFSIIQTKRRKQDLKATNYNPSLHRKIGIYIHPIDMYNKTMI